jgi:hypothetical protein
MNRLEKRLTDQIPKPAPPLDIGGLRTEIMDECKQMLKMELIALGLNQPPSRPNIIKALQPKR